MEDVFSQGPCHTLLRTNIPPSHNEAQDVRRLLLAEKANVRKLEEEYELAKALLGAARDRVEDYRCILSPARRIPPEIVTHIFWFCCEETHPNYTTLPPDPRRMQITLTHICSAWRKVAHTTVCPWSEIICSVADQRQLDLLDGLTTVWRHPSLALKLRLWSRPSVHISDEFWSTMTHYTNISFDAITLVDLYIFLAPISNCLGSLEHLTLAIQDDFDFQDEDSITIDTKALDLGSNVFKNSLRLRTVLLMNNRISAPRRSSDTLLLPWSQLTALSLQNGTMDLQDIIDVVMRCTRLEAIQFGPLLNMDAPPSALSPPVKLHFLHTLTLTIADDEAELFFDSFTLPALQSLTTEGDPIDWSSVTFMSFLVRSSPRLTSLQLCNEFPDPTDLLAILTRAPTLTKLCLENCYDATFDALLQMLNYYNDSSTPLLPRLESLVLGVGETNLQDLITFISSRWRPESDAAHLLANLREVELPFIGRQARNMVSTALARCIAQGLAMRF